MTTIGSDVVSSTNTYASPQMSMKSGIKRFGDAGREAVKRELQQLHDCKVVKGVRKDQLTPLQRKEALGYLMFIKQK